MIWICGRKVKVKTGGNTQTVNVCTAENIHGRYDYRVRLRKPYFTTENELLASDFTSIEHLVEFLQRERFAELEMSPDGRSVVNESGEKYIASSRTPTQQPGDPEDAYRPGIADLGDWHIRAKKAVEETIDRLVMDFIFQPYLHRREHSIHCELFRMLASNRQFAESCPMGRWQSQPLHKEWPEFRLRPGKSKRGNFDICVLSPLTLARATLPAFTNGTLQPSIVIEIALNYDLSHLKDDAAKLANSGIADSYLVHLAQEHYSDNFKEVESFIVRSPFKSAYARVTSTEAWFKLVRDTTIRRASLGQLLNDGRRVSSAT
ncbi:MAG: hypothetical protein L0387_33865 [Acidobacteria bacterium]|nr:hypothetical protein [Acidobacteriota bacterium]